MGCFSTLLQVVDNWPPTFCGSRFSTRRLLAIEGFKFSLILAKCIANIQTYRWTDILKDIFIYKIMNKIELYNTSTSCWKFIIIYYVNCRNLKILWEFVQNLHFLKYHSFSHILLDLLPSFYRHLLPIVLGNFKIKQLSWARLTNRLFFSETK